MTDTMGWDLEAAAGLALKVGELTDELRSDRARRQQRDRQPILGSFSGSAIAPASGLLVIDLGGPQLGRLWLVRRLLIGGLTWATTAAGAAEVYTSDPTGASSRTLTEMVDQAATLPSKAYYSAEQITVVAPQRLQVVISGATNLQQYVATGAALDVPVAAFYEPWSL